MLFSEATQVRGIPAVSMAAQKRYYLVILEYYKVFSFFHCEEWKNVLLGNLINRIRIRPGSHRLQLPEGGAERWVSLMRLSTASNSSQLSAMRLPFLRDKSGGMTDCPFLQTQPSIIEAEVVENPLLVPRKPIRSGSDELHPLSFDIRRRPRSAAKSSGALTRWLAAAHTASTPVKSHTGAGHPASAHSP